MKHISDHLSVLSQFPWFYFEAWLCWLLQRSSFTLFRLLFRRWECFCGRRISICFIIKITVSILRCDVWYWTNLTIRKIPPKKHLRLLLICTKCKFCLKNCKYVGRYLIRFSKSFRPLHISSKMIFSFLIYSFCPPLYFSLPGIALEDDWRKILRVYDVINCVNKNLIAYFVWYYEKK